MLAKGEVHDVLDCEAANNGDCLLYDLADEEMVAQPAAQFALNPLTDSHEFTIQDLYKLTPTKYASGQLPRPITPTLDNLEEESASLKLLEEDRRILVDSYKSGVPLSDTNSNMIISPIMLRPAEQKTAKIMAPKSSSTPRESPQTPSTKRRTSLFGFTKSVSVPDDALMHTQVEGHFGGVSDDIKKCGASFSISSTSNDPRACKIFGKAVMWIVKDADDHVLVVRSPSGNGFTFRLKDLTVCQKTETFRHGGFSIDNDAHLGFLLELQGRCKLPETDKPKDMPSVMANADGHVHLAVRGLREMVVDEWVAKIGQRTLPDALPRGPKQSSSPAAASTIFN